MADECAENSYIHRTFVQKVVRQLPGNFHCPVMGHKHFGKTDSQRAFQHIACQCESGGGFSEGAQYVCHARVSGAKLSDIFFVYAFTDYNGKAE